MKPSWRSRFLGLLTAATLSLGILSCHEHQPTKPDPDTTWHHVDLRPSTQRAPAVSEEFRGVWVASVENINWPSRPGLSSAQQQAELTAVLDRAAALRLNAVLLQVRPAADALYDSPLEPWSRYLTGTEGTPPQPYYDPLAFAVQQAHARGLELHAWVNPFRAKPASVSAASTRSLAAAHPDWVRPYGNLLWLDPGEPAAREHTLRVLADIVRRYDIDGLHIDDYFYPYPIKQNGAPVAFPDADTYARYGQGLSLGDWRRHNINTFVQSLYSQTHALKPWVKVGISPFGIWRPGHPAQVKGFDAYDQIYGDSRTWLREGWIDYLSPQLYWPIDRTPQSFPALLAWWQSENIQHRHLWPGLYSAKADPSPSSSSKPTTTPSIWTPAEIEYQIRTTRGLTPTPDLPGHIHFSASILRDHSPTFDHLANTVYRDPALVPATPWLDNQTTPPAAPQDIKLDLSPTRLWLHWTPDPSSTLFIIQLRDRTGWTTPIISARPILECPRPQTDLLTISITARDRTGRTSPPIVLELNP